MQVSYHIGRSTPDRVRSPDLMHGLIMTFKGRLWNNSDLSTRYTVSNDFHWASENQFWPPAMLYTCHLWLFQIDSEQGLTFLPKERVSSIVGSEPILTSRPYTVNLWPWQVNPGQGVTSHRTVLVVSNIYMLTTHERWTPDSIYLAFYDLHSSILD